MNRQRRNYKVGTKGEENEGETSKNDIQMSGRTQKIERRKLKWEYSKWKWYERQKAKDKIIRN